MKQQAVVTAKLSIIKYPSGRFGFVGSAVPGVLAYVHADGSQPTPSELRDIAESSCPAMTMKAYGIKSRAFLTEQEARFVAARLGFGGAL